VDKTKYLFDKFSKNDFKTAAAKNKQTVLDNTTKLLMSANTKPSQSSGN
jgi:hypothetical protein